VPPTIIFLLASYPAFRWLAASPTFDHLLILQFALGLFAAWYLGVLPSIMAELFPPRYRASGLSISYASAVTIFGGFTPVITTSLIHYTGNKLVPSFYLIFAAAVSLIGLIEARRIGIK
jgi:MHS family proline/betaine transporter-like MFS transporter